MASLSVNKRNGHKTVQFVAGDSKRRSIRLGNLPMGEAREIKKHVDALNTAAISGEPWKREQAMWIRDVDRALYDKLAAVGLTAVRNRQTKLGPFLADYVKRRGDVEPATKIVYGHTIR